MPTRRQFVAQVAIAGGSARLALASEGETVRSREATRAAKSLRILFLGGTGNIGPYHVRAALERGHRVTVFSRGKASVELPPAVEHLTGDRNGDLSSIENRDWDAVVDLATYVPKWVRSLGEALKGRVNHYTFISSEAVYDNPATNVRGIDEGSKLLSYGGAADPYTITELNDDAPYGSMKVLCEGEAERRFPGKCLIVRPGGIVGPGDAVGAFTYWAARIEKGGEVLAAGEPLTRVQMIDVRDLAEWVVRMIENRETGVYNAIGPAMPMGWAEMLGALRGNTSGSMKLTWVPISWLSERNVKAWSNLLFWPCEAGVPGLMRSINEKACARGLTFRPLSLTMADTLAWYNNLPNGQQEKSLMGVDGMSAMQSSMTREREILAAWKIHQQIGV